MRYHILSISLVILSGLLIYGSTLQSPYHWDDYRTIVDNPTLADPFQLETVLSFWPTRAFLFWTFSLNQVAGGSPLFAYHLTNIAIHLAAASALYLLIFRTLSIAIPASVGAASSRDHVAGQSRLEAAPTVCRPIPVGEICRRSSVIPDNPERQKEYAWIAALAALIFVTHPIATGAVTYLIQRGVLLSAALGLLSILVYTYARGLSFSQGRRFFSPLHLLLYGLSLIFLCLAMLSKEGALVFPILIVCWELIFGGAGASGRSRFFYLLPFILSIAIIPLISLAIVKSAALQDDVLYRINSPWRPVAVTFLDGGGGSYLASSWEYFLTQLKSIAIYIRLSLFPVQQNFYYHLMPRHSLFQGKTLFLLMGYLSLILIGIKLLLRVNSKERTVGEDRRNARSMHFQYGESKTDSAVPAVPFTFQGERIPAPINRRLMGTGILWFFIALLPTSSFLILWPFLSEFHLYISLAGLSFFWAGVLVLPRKSDYRRLFRSLLLLSILAFALLAIKRNAVYSSAVSLWEDTVKKSPRLAPAHSNLAAAYIGQGDYRKAIEASRLAMDLNSSFNGYRNLRTAYRALGERKKANELIEEEIERFPDSYRGYFEKALTIITEDPDSARRFLLKALEKHPPPEIKAGIEREVSKTKKVPKVR